MPNTRQSAKRVKQTHRRTERNARVESATRTVIRLAAASVKTQKDTKVLEAELQKAATALAKAASKGVIPKERAARKTRRLVAMARKLHPELKSANPSK